MKQQKIFKYFLIQILSLSIASSIPTNGVFAQANNTESSNGKEDEMIPREIVERLMGNRGITGSKTKILLGKLPESISEELLLPPNTKVLVATVSGEYFYRVEVDVPQSPQQVESFYQQKLQSAGWKRQQVPDTEVGFLSSNYITNKNLGFCKTKRGPALNLRISQAPTNPTAMGIDYIADGDHYSCRFQESPFDIVPIPPLRAPANTNVSPKIPRGWSSEGRNSQATLESQLSLEQLSKHYGQQMEKESWTKISDAKNDQSLWSMWTFKDKENISWQGIMSLKASGDKPNQYSANLLILKE